MGIEPVGVVEFIVERRAPAVDLSGKGRAQPMPRFLTGAGVRPLYPVIDILRQQSVPGLAKPAIDWIRRVELRQPIRQRLAVVAGGNDAPVMKPVRGIGQPAAEENAAAILVRQRDDA